MDKNSLIAVVGVSANPGKYGHKVFRDLLKAGYRAVGVNPKGEDVLGRKIFRHLSEVKPQPDVVITVVPPEITEKIIDDCHTLGIKNIWMQPGSESGNAVNKANRLGLNVVSACFMTSKGIW